MDLNEIATFVRVVETGSFSKAATQLGIPRSTVSRRITRLEETLCLRLLERTTRRMKLTDEGQVYFEQVAPAVNAVVSAGEVAKDLRGDPRGVLRITAPVDFGQEHLSWLTAEFMGLYPDIQVHMDLTNRVVDLVKEGFDLAIRGGTLADSSFIARRLESVEMWMFASPDYLSAHGSPRTPADLKNHKCLLFLTASTSQRWRLYREDGREHATVVTGPCETNDFTFMREVAVRGAGVALMPVFVGIQPMRDGRLVRVLPEWHGKGGGLHLVMPSGRYLPAKTRAFRDFLIERLKEPPWREGCKEEGGKQADQEDGMADGNAPARAR